MGKTLKISQIQPRGCSLVVPSLHCCTRGCCSASAWLCLALLLPLLRVQKEWGQALPSNAQGTGHKVEHSGGSNCAQGNRAGDQAVTEVWRAFPAPSWGDRVHC